eukprot:1332878-Amorphochlora_amoeboformis.AAC.1
MQGSKRWRPSRHHFPPGSIGVKRVAVSVIQRVFGLRWVREPLLVTPRGRRHPDLPCNLG